MKSLTFTDKWLKALKSGTEREEFADLACPGLRLRVGARSMTWSSLSRLNGKRQRTTLGSYPAISLKAAREACSNREFVTPADDDRSEQVGTLHDLLQLKVQQMESEDRESATQYSGYFFNGPESVIAVIGGDRPANQILPEDCTNWLRKIHQRGTETKHPRAYLSAAFSFGLKYDNDPKSARPDVRFGLTQNPVQHVGGGGSARARKRHLSMNELIQFWHTFGGRRVHPQSRILLRMIFAMGGVRITEVVRSQKDWWQERKPGDFWLCLPKTKNEKEHNLPVTRNGLELLKAAMIVGDDQSHFLFPSSEDPSVARTLSGVSQVVRRWCDNQDDFERFQPRDIRRTMKTMLIEEKNIDPAWVDIWHNHGRGSDVARKHYDWAEYASAKRAVANAIDEIIDEVKQPIPEAAS